ncbi:MAG: hypothetical protein R2830_01900 [Saprospiraceae bacterium]
MKKTMTWLPRIFSLLFVGLLVLLSLDAFSENTPLGYQIIGFLIHLFPAFSVLVCLLIAWRYRLVGGVLFMALGLIFTIYFGTYRSISHFLMISLPLFVVGVLFMVSQGWTGGKNNNHQAINE